MTKRQTHPWNDQYKFLDLSQLVEDPHITVVALNRPQKRNALDAVLWKDIGSCFSRLAREGDGCRCILLTAKGSVFCAGIDISDPSLLLPPGDDVARRGLAFLPQIQGMQQAFTALETCPVPVVAVIHGACIGAGVDLICAASVRLATEDAVFCVKEVALGLAADVGTLQRLPNITGNGSLATEVCLTGRNFAAPEALAMGLVSRITTNALDDGLQICRQIARHSPVAVVGTKKSLLYAHDHSVQEGLDQIAAYNALALQGGDLTTAFAAASRQEKAEYDDLHPASKL